MTQKIESRDDLTSWQGYRRFMKRGLNQLPPEPSPIFISKQRVEFDIDGQEWTGLAVLVGPRSELAVKKLLKEGLRFRAGTCRVSGGDLEVTGIPDNAVKLAQFTLKRLRLGYALVGGDEDETTSGSSGEPAPAVGATRSFEIGASVGRGGKNVAEDVAAVQIALNRRTGARLSVDGRCSAATVRAISEFQRALGQARPDGRVEPGRGTARALAASGKLGPPPPPPKPMPPPKLGPPSLGRSPKVWRGARTVLAHNVGELKRAISQEYSNEHPGLKAEIDQGVKQVDRILLKLDDRLARALDRANAATDAAEREKMVRATRVIVKQYVQYLKTDPLIGHLDRNPFGVSTNLRRVITDSLKNIVQSTQRPAQD